MRSVTYFSLLVLLSAGLLLGRMLPSAVQIASTFYVWIGPVLPVAALLSADLWLSGRRRRAAILLATGVALSLAYGRAIVLVASTDLPLVPLLLAFSSPLLAAVALFVVLYRGLPDGLRGTWARDSMLAWTPVLLYFLVPAFGKGGLGYELALNAVWPAWMLIVGTIARRRTLSMREIQPPVNPGPEARGD